MDHMWDYVRGDSTVKPEESNAGHDAWVTQDQAACQRIFLALSDEIKESILHLADSPTAVIFKSLKEAYKYSGTSAEYYTRQDYHNVKVNDYDSIRDFITGLMKLAHQVNKTTSKATDHIGERQIAMRIIHSLLSSMHTLQTLLIETAPVTPQTWNLSTLRQQIVTDE